MQLTHIHSNFYTLYPDFYTQSWGNQPIIYGFLTQDSTNYHHEISELKYDSYLNEIQLETATDWISKTENYEFSEECHNDFHAKQHCTNTIKAKILEHGQVQESAIQSYKCYY